MSKSKNCTCVQCGKSRIPERLLTLPDGTRSNLCHACRNPDKAKTCSHCQEAKPLDRFYTSARPDQKSLSYGAVCKACRSILGKLHHPVKRLQRYGMTPESYSKMLDEQGGKCAACRTTEPADTEWHIDHDHACCPGERTCGKCVRGLLCRDCNLALGHAREDVGRLLGLADYISGLRGNGSTPVLQAEIRRNVATGT